MIRTRTAALLALLLTLGAADLAAQVVPGRLPRIRVQGNQFVDWSGNRVVFRGVSFSDPDRLEKAGQWNRAYFEAARSWNANVVRIPVHPQAWRERGPAAYLRLLDQGVQWAGELGMYVIIDWHSIGNLRTELFQSANYHTTKPETYQFWRAIAERFGRNPVVAFYELFNEPTTSSGRLGRMSWPDHKETMEEIISILHAHDPGIIALVAGFDWAYDLTPLHESPIDAPNVAYVAHPYPQKRDAPWEEKWERDWGFVADRYPVIATELGFMDPVERGAHIPVLGDERYGTALVDFFERKGISWTAWVFDPAWSPQLLRGWDFAPTRQGAFFRDAMLRLNEPNPRR